MISYLEYAMLRYFLTSYFDFSLADAFIEKSFHLLRQPFLNLEFVYLVDYATVFMSEPISEMVIFTTSPLCKVKSSVGIIPVPVIK